MQRPTRLGKYVDLTNPIEVEEYIYALDRKNIYKNKPFQGYRYFCEANTIHYKKPKTLHEEQFLINPPTRARDLRDLASK